MAWLVQRVAKLEQRHAVRRLRGTCAAGRFPLSLPSPPLFRDLLFSFLPHTSQHFPCRGHPSASMGGAGPPRTGRMVPLLGGGPLLLLALVFQQPSLAAAAKATAAAVVGHGEGGRPIWRSWDAYVAHNNKLPRPDLTHCHLAKEIRVRRRPTVAPGLLRVGGARPASGAHRPRPPASPAPAPGHRRRT